ncbi:hypothetical protein KIN20_007743 [Parelaphostrongylus tenuis]|uniref:Uncharacterized protein n=1 Tax=Parelaphostrongylus tenuis TaxID=148309 RepID=A0AAD5QH18_PARTN|nr:hypothetical protein KIN20_007743 [Parelaphostrongylus tenuis]
MILRQRATKEKMKAARDVVQGKCTVNSVRKNLMLDPTRITAFPMSEMTSLSKRHLRTSPPYQTEVLGGKSRLDIAASKIIAHTFSEVDHVDFKSRYLLPIAKISLLFFLFTLLLLYSAYYLNVLSLS